MPRLHAARSRLKRSASDALRRPRDDRSGVTAIEYALIAGAIAVAIIATVIALGGDLQNLFTTTGSALSSTTGSTL